MHKKDATPIEAIDFESLQQPDSNRQSHKATSSLTNTKLYAWLVFIFLLLCALIVFLFLPNYVSENNNSQANHKKERTELPKIVKQSKTVIESETIAEIKIPESVAELSAVELNALKQESEELLLQLIEKQDLLESKAVKKWAGEEYRIALTLGARGDESFRKKEYQQAIIEYKDAVMILNDLEEKISPALQTHLEKGELALTQAEKDTAIFHFELAASIEAENIQAINGLKRANTIEELYRLLNQGGKFEAANRFTDAKETYYKAIELDPLSNEAKEAHTRVSNRLAQNEFTKLINQAYTELKLRQYGDARATFEAAEKLSPSSNKPKQGLASIAQAIRSEKLSALMVEAQHFETTQDWGNATKSYQQMLALSPNLSSAQQGLKRNQQREEILINLQEYISSPLRLSTDQVANQAKQLLQEIASANNPGSKIEQAAVELNELLELAKQPISITLQSDNQTDIAIFKVGKLGKFEQHKLALKIGKYTIVGSRAGFRDVRKVLSISPDMLEKTISIRCEEPI